MPHRYRKLTCHMGSRSVTCHPAEVRIPPLPPVTFPMPYHSANTQHVDFISALFILCVFCTFGRCVAGAIAVVWSLYAALRYTDVYCCDTM